MRRSAIVTFFGMGCTMLIIPGIFAATPAGSSSLVFEQTGVIDPPATITVLFPSGEERTFRDVNYSLHDLAAGRYTVFIDPAEGMTTSVDLTDGSAVIQSNKYPQVSLELPEGVTNYLSIEHRLTHYGQVSVISEPPGMPFRLVGPNSVERRGVTPASFTLMPIGQYAVWYEPVGCWSLPAKAGALESDKRLSFSTTINCNTFQPQTAAASSAGSITRPQTRKLAAPAESAQAKRFDDVSNGDWFSEYVDAAAANRILEGYRREDGTLTGLFGPGDLVTLGQFAKIVHATLDLPPPNPSGVPANPRAQNQWFSHFFASAENQDWRVFFSDPEQDPLRPVKRGEVAVTFLQALDLPQQWSTGTVFKDVSRRTAYASAIETLAKDRLLAGNAAGNFEPDRPVTRAEMAKIATMIRRKYVEGKSGSVPAAQASSVR